MVCWSEHYTRDVDSSERLRAGDFTLADVAALTTEQVITAELLRDELAEPLGADPGSPALVVTRRHFDGSQRVVDIGVHTHPADRYRIRTMFPATPDRD